MATYESRDLALQTGRQLGAPMAAPAPSVEPRALDVDLLEVVRAIWRRRWTVVAMTLIGAMAAFVLAMAWPTTFTSHTRLMLESRRNQLIETNAIFNELDPTDEVVETEIEVVLSRSVRELAAISANLPLMLERRAAGADEQVIDILLRWWRDLAMPELQSRLPTALAELLPQPEPNEPATLDDAVEFLDNNLSARQIGNTLVIEISMTDRNANDAADIANTIANEYMANQIAWKRSATSGANSWLSARIEELESEISGKRQALERLRGATGLVGGGTESLVGQGQTLINQRLLDAQAERIRLQTESAAMRRLLDERGPAEIANLLESPVIAQLRLDVSAANQRLAELESIYGPKHPLRLDAEAQLERALSDIRLEAQKELTAKRTALAAAAAEERELEVALAEQSERGRELGTQRTSLAALENEIETMQGLLDNYLTRYKETLEQQSIIRADARVISAAVAPEHPDPPSKKLILLGGVLIAGVIGILVAFARDALDHTIRSVAAAERVLQVPVQGAIPKLGGTLRKHSPVDYVLERPTSAFVESLRNLVTGMGVTKALKDTHCLLVTSAVPGEGKSSTAAAIGRVMQRAGHSVALVECDLRRPGLAKVLRCMPNVGLMQLADGKIEEFETVQRDPASGMTFVAAGGHSENSLYLLQSPKLGELITWLGTTHDLIILDSPPVVPLPDAQVLTDLADSVLFLCRWGSTKSSTSAAGVRMLVRQGGAPVYAALSQVDRRQYAGYDVAYSDAGYGHYYRD